MIMTEWADREITAACKKANPEWDGKSFDYRCSCYQSALKAYKSLMEDGHSGFSYSITKNILIKLLNNIPLSPITDEDFFMFADETEEWASMNNEGFLKDTKLKSRYQCPRRTSLFRYEHLDGTITYHDHDRAYCVDINNPSVSYYSGMTRIIDDMFPITMPYTPSNKQYTVNTEEFLLDPKNGDFDHCRVVSIVTPDGEEIPINNPKYIKREVNGKMESCTLKEWYADYEVFKERN